MAKKKTTEQFKKEVYDLEMDNYEVLGEYKGNKIKITMKHNKCGTIYDVKPNVFLTGSRCPNCCKSKKKTTESFREEVYNKYGDEYTVLGEYINSATKIEVIHNLCGRKYEINPSYLLKGGRCRCLQKNYKMSHEDFLNKMHLKKGHEYEVLESYVNSKTKIKFIHKICGSEFYMRPAQFLNGQNCPNCYGTPKKTLEEFKKEVYDMYGDEYKVIGDYKGKGEFIKIKHKLCDTEFNVTPNNFLRGSRCPKCYGTPKRTKEEFRQEVYNLVGYEYEPITDYITSGDKVTMIHNKCGYIYDVVAISFLKGARCPKCAGNKRLTTEEFQEKVFKLVKDEYEVLDPYINSSTKITFKHNTCGNTFKTVPNSFVQGSRCPICMSRKGEKAIIDFLNKYKISYEYDKSYGECKYKGSLRFDFLIYDEKNNLKLICEFDGKQHFEPVDLFGGEKAFKETKIRDNIKNKFCKDKEIPLVRIPYWEIDNIHKILGKKIYKLGLIE